jgi:PAS domain S-box-containing protein
MAEQDDMAAVADQLEHARLAALRQYAVLDTAPESIYDDVTQLASQLCNTPIALISLIDTSRQWFKSRVGLAVAETPRDIAFCNWAIKGDALFEVPDAAQDERFSDNPLVTGDPNIRFYAGAPLRTADGHRVGTLCVIDRQPRELLPSQRAALVVLARQVVLQFEMRRNLAELSEVRAALEAETQRLARAEAVQRRAEQFMRGTIDALQDNIAIIDADGVIVHVNQAWEAFARSNASAQALVVCMHGANYLAVCDRALARGAVEAGQVAGAARAMLAGQTSGEFQLEYPCHAPNEKRWFEVRVTGFVAGAERFAVLSHRNITARFLAQREVLSLNSSLEARVLERTGELESVNARLRASEARFLSIFDNASVGAVVIDRDGRMLRANQAMSVITGRDAAWLASSSYGDIVHPDDRASLLELRARLLDGQIPGYVTEARFVRPSGDVAWVTISVSAVRNSAGLVTQTMALVQDVSQQHHAAYERDQFFERSQDIFVIADLKGAIHRSNPACQRILGYSAEELAHLHYLDLVHPDDRAVTLPELGRLAAGAPLELIDVRLRDKAGRYHDLRWSATLWGERGLILAVGRDITARQAAERALQEREAMLARAEHMAQMGSCYLDTEQGNVRCSRGFLELAGLPQPTESRSIDDILPIFVEQDRALLQQAIDRVVSLGEPAEVPCRLRRSDGVERELQIFIEPRRNPDGQITGVSGACLDVTEFRLATRQAQLSEQRLRALADRLQRIREEERTRISREIHDELGQMLTALKIDLTLMARDFAGDGAMPPRERLHEDVVSMCNMIDATLQAVRRIARQLRPEMLDALGLVPAIEWQASEMQARTGLHCSVHASDALADIDSRRATALFRIAQEALTNVVRHAGATSVSIVLQREGDALQMTVQDDGKGFDPETGGPSMSLGVLGMRERAQAQGAIFELDSRPGSGTRVTVRLPLTTPSGVPEGELTA